MLKIKENNGTEEIDLVTPPLVYKHAITPNEDINASSTTGIRLNIYRHFTGFFYS